MFNVKTVLCNTCRKLEPFVYVVFRITGLKYFLVILEVFFHPVEKLGYHVTKNNFYNPIPDTGELRKTPDIWERESDLVGIDLNLEVQVFHLQEIIGKYSKEVDYSNRVEPDQQQKYFCYDTGGFKAVDAEALYGMIRHYRPKRVIEIGGGGSTILSAGAVRKNRSKGFDAELITIEPYPDEQRHGKPFLTEDIEGVSQIIKKKVQDVELDFFKTLQLNDILFIDSSHVAATGSDVCYEYLEILPNLRKGVIVHIHDIFFPKEYPKEWTLEYRNHFWNEQYILQAFLAFNSAFEILWCGSYFHYKYPSMLEEMIKNYDRNAVIPGSIWLRKSR